ncbi:uncharacterized protein LOC132741667 [Ruditapes philippinarum]|uniref:uncharacterized protein LOC132741667 n=1 Tax=Ruditapes philippinarum TaxID=129788 RepID=UPI00295B0E18|nr:uncharacterized protein LOC132741667 [Ruditapes philippinarum]
MAVHGKKAPHPYLPSVIDSDEYLEVYCQPCNIEGERIPAHGFCTDCNEHLCGTCFKLHKKHKLSRNHTLLDKENMPKRMHAPTSSSVHLHQSDELTKACLKHQKEMIKFYCHDHKELLCSVCVTLQHSATLCKVDYIPDISVDITDSKYYNDILRNLDRVTDLCKKISEDTRKIIAKSEKSVTDALADIRKFRKEINQRLDELENQAEDDAEALQEEIRINLKTVERNCEDTATSLKTTTDFIKRLNATGQADRLFMELKMTEQMIEECEKKVQQVPSYNYEEYTFQANHDLSAFLKNDMAFGTFSKKPAEEPSVSSSDHVRTRQANLQTKICVKTSEDNEICRISGMTLFTPDLLIITDNRNKAVKLIDVRGHSIIHQIDVDGKPCDITAISSTELAVTLPDQKLIQFISASTSRLSMKTALKVNGECYGISCYKGRLVVSFCNPAKLQILDVNGTVLTDFTGENIFSNPVYVKACSDFIYVSDWKKGTITRLNWQGDVVGIYNGMDCPSGFTLTNKGTLFACDYSKEVVEEVSSDCSEGNILMSDLKRLEALCWCGETNKLYFSTFTGDIKYDNFLQVYKLS